MIITSYYYTQDSCEGARSVFAPFSLQNLIFAKIREFKFFHPSDDLEPGVPLFGACTFNNALPVSLNAVQSTPISKSKGLILSVRYDRISLLVKPVAAEVNKN